MSSVILSFLIRCFVAVADAQFQNTPATLYAVAIGTITPKQAEEINRIHAARQAQRVKWQAEQQEWDARNQRRKEEHTHYVTVVLPYYKLMRDYSDFRGVLFRANRAVYSSVYERTGYKIPLPAQRLPVLTVTIPRLK